MTDEMKGIDLRPCTTYTPVGTRVLVVYPGHAPVLTRTEGIVRVGKRLSAVRVEGFMCTQDLRRVWLLPEEGEKR